jgi:hypothetical protein
MKNPLKNKKKQETKKMWKRQVKIKGAPISENVVI